METKTPVEFLGNEKLEFLSYHSDSEKEEVFKILSIAKVCHQANKAYCEIQGDFSQKDWQDAEDWQIASAFNGVKFRLENPEAGHDAMHNNWMKEKVENGWVYGEVKDTEAKTHPCIVPFEQLPIFQQKKDALFSAIVDALK